VLPSYREGLPLVLAEAAACGRPCITTDVPGCREAVRDGENGWLVPPRDGAALARAIHEAVANPVELQRRGAAGRLRAEREFSQTLVLEAFLALYGSLLERSAKGTELATNFP
jgi:glycosyltransferase involved in cell wall biosynthesis